MAIFSPHGDTLILLLAVLSVLLLVEVDLSRSSALASSHFEGFDPEANEIDFAGETIVFATPAPPATSLSGPYPDIHHSPPSTPLPPSPSDLWDEDEFEGIPPTAHSQDHHHDSADDPTLSASCTPAEEASSSTLPTSTSLWSYSLELACISFLICFALNYFHGKRRNEAIAHAWATKFAAKDLIFDKNFSLVGVGDGNDAPLLLKEGQHVFKFYASGRRYCQGMLATMELLSRHDLISRSLHLVFSKKDTITFEVVMNEDAMDHVVLALARKKTVKAMLKEERDLQKFASPVLAPPTGRNWVADELMVVAESKEVAGDLITDVVLDQVFGSKAFATLGKWFISLHFSDHPGYRKKNLIFKFVLPDANGMSDLAKLITLIPYYIDLIGRYKLSSHARSKTEAARTKAAQEVYKELQNLRQEASQKKKAEKKKLWEEVEAKLSAEALHKKEEKERARQLKKSGPKVKMLRR